MGLTILPNNPGTMHLQLSCQHGQGLTSKTSDFRGSKEEGAEVTATKLLETRGGPAEQAQAVNQLRRVPHRTSTCDSSSATFGVEISSYY
eukprot:1897506-Amphidinium_carterae.1